MGFSYKRSSRVGDLIFREVSSILNRGEVNDPRVSSVSLTDIYISDDMGFARIFFTIIDPEKSKEDVLEGLQSSTGFIKKILSRRLKLKKIPKLEFRFDDVLERGYRVDDLIKEASDE